MKKTAIFYGSLTGTTKDIAHKIGNLLGIEDKDIYDVAQTAPSVVADYDNLILGSSTWGDGELEEDWYDFIAGLEVLDLKGKKIALFGCGDETMGSTFCAAVGELYNRLQKTGAEFTGDYDIAGYDVSETPAMIGGKIVGLLIDEVNHPELTPRRLAGWTAELNGKL